MSRDSRKKLRAGFTTGTAAAAAVRGALTLLLSGAAPASVRIQLLTGGEITIPVRRCEISEAGMALCTVIKDGGDDPDVTHNAKIGARVRILANGDGPDLLITGGEGVGRVTKPGLEILPGEAAINSGPRKMIRQVVDEVLAAHGKTACVEAEIFVPDGEVMARKTLNARLGILGGISILGTTGVVRPLSHEAYIATIHSAMSVARAAGLDRTVLTTGRRSERFAQAIWPDLPEEAFVQIGDFFQKSLEAASSKGFREVCITVFFGKAVKMAQGVPHTHAARSELTLHRLSQWALDITGDRDLADRIASANTARHAFDMIWPLHPQLVRHVGHRIVDAARKFASPALGIRSLIFDFDGNPVFDSDDAAD